MAYRFALAGNPNSGKTTLFNNLTGSNAHVGNWPGVTVERKEGKCKKTKEDIHIIDLPGIYSLSPYTPEEVIARDYLSQEAPDLIINIVDATNIERNLYLTTQLIELGIPMVIALNMMDEVNKHGDVINTEGLEKELGVPVIPITAVKGQGIKELLERAVAFAKNPKPHGKTALEKTQLGDAIEGIREILKKSGYGNTLYYAIKLLEKDSIIKDKLKLDQGFSKAIDEIAAAEEGKAEEETETIIADLRYRYISEIVSKHIKKGRKQEELSFSDKIDNIVTSRILGLPIFFLVMYAIFQIALGPIGTAIADPFAEFTGEVVPEAVAGFLERIGVSDILMSLVVDGIFAGLGALLGFLPLILLLFLCLSLLEDSGYMARVAFVMDRVFRPFGLSGKAFVPLLMGYGCAIPAIMGTRTLEDEKSRRLTITLMPFMSCGARIPVYAVFAGAFFASNQGTIVFSIYALGVVVAMLSCVLLNRTVFKGEAPPFVMELPPYRIPSIKSVLIHTWDKAKGYVIKVGTVLLSMMVIIWFCQTFDFSLQMVEDSADSIFGIIGGWLAPLFTLNGFGVIKGTTEIHWQIGAALLAGLVAKEAVVGTLGILYIGQELEELTGALGAALEAHFTPLAAYSLMVFVLLYAPCFAAIATAKKELDSWKWTLFTVAYQCGVAWIVSMLVYQIGSLLGIGLA
ncbi:ferrous iron transport protein B [Geosporobacter subterraneus DSM 17957]|uniref:Ferrous iron transport protein B n=1 Tax=Geosporobacter subterraneus DSM 17957 TaxID=1121919 RepID=A0A1M6F4K8_9FIRM|nr:ferrous iron transport protein B [Geosporobacter subterraneus]SHI92592.1 ferrous iron transport protein B [Geosporobacter subterraneus DSM 17957]